MLSRHPSVPFTVFLKNFRMREREGAYPVADLLRSVQRGPNKGHKERITVVLICGFLCKFRELAPNRTCRRSAVAPLPPAVSCCLLPAASPPEQHLGKQTPTDSLGKGRVTHKPVDPASRGSSFAD